MPAACWSTRLRTRVARSSHRMSAGCANGRRPSGNAEADSRRRRAPAALHRLELDGELVDQVPYARHQLAAGDRADVHLPVVAHHRDVEPGAVEDRAERIERVDPRADEVQRDRRPGDVRDHQVVDDRSPLGEPEVGHHAHRQPERPRRRELRPLLQGVRWYGRVVILGVRVGHGHLGDPLERVLDVGAEPAEDRRDLVAPAGPVRLVAHRHRDAGQQRRVGQLTAILR